MANNNEGHSSTIDSHIWQEIDAIAASIASSASLTPVISISEQPASRFRFRYESDPQKIPIRGRTAKRFPTIKIDNFVGTATVRVSCVTTDEPYRPHPYELRKHKSTEPDTSGVYKFKYQVKSDSKEYEIKNLRLVQVWIKDFAKCLRKRQNLNIHPSIEVFSEDVIGKMKGEYENHINAHAIRLCFEVFFPANVPSVDPIVSEIIRNIKANSKPKIKQQYPASASVTGGAEYYLLCNKVEADYEVIFYLEDEKRQRVWEQKTTFELLTPTCIKLEVPQFRDLTVKENILVKIQVTNRTMDEPLSDRIDFEYICIPEDRKLLNKRISDLLEIYIQAKETKSKEVPISTPVCSPQMGNNPSTSHDYVPASPQVFDNYPTTSHSFVPPLRPVPNNNSTAMRKTVSQFLSGCNVEEQPMSVGQIEDTVNIDRTMPMSVDQSLEGVNSSQAGYCPEMISSDELEAYNFYI